MTNALQDSIISGLDLGLATNWPRHNIKAACLLLARVIRVQIPIVIKTHVTLQFCVLHSEHKKMASILISKNYAFIQSGKQVKSKNVSFWRRVQMAKTVDAKGVPLVVKTKNVTAWNQLFADISFYLLFS